MNKLIVKLLYGVTVLILISGCTNQSNSPAIENKQEAQNTQNTPNPVATPNTSQNTGIKLEPIAQGFTSPLVITSTNDETKRLFVADQIGVIKIIDSNGNIIDEPFLDLRRNIVRLNSSYDERGLLGLAFHPYFNENGQFYVYYSGPLKNGGIRGYSHTNYLVEYKVDPTNPNKADKNSGKIVLSIDNPYENHNGGTLKFGPDGYLYISVGDGGNKNDIGRGHSDIGNGQDYTNLLGSILRIDINNDEKYAIPIDNPVLGNNVRSEIFAYGLRNPFRFSFDKSGDHQLIAGDVGQGRWEEINIINTGGNYGWNIKEGNHCFDKTNESRNFDDCTQTGNNGESLTDPIIEYKNANTQGGIGLSVIGGYVYRGNSIPGLQGMYIFGDWSNSFTNPNGKIFISQIGKNSQFSEIYQLNSEFLMGFGEDLNGEIYVLTTQNMGPNGNSGKIYKIVSN